MSVEMAHISSRQATSSSRGKRPKHFLGKNESLSLAAAISDVQENKIQLKVDRKHKVQAAQPQQIPKPVSRTKSKLKETKDMLVARRMQAKRDKKFRSRKQRLQSDVKCKEGSGVGQSMDKVQKKVSFL